MRRINLPATGLSFVVAMASATLSKAEPGACCFGDACVEVADAADCHAYTCDVAALLAETFLGCFGDADGNGFVNAGDRGISCRSRARSACRSGLA